MKLSKWSSQQRQLLNGFIICASALVCACLTFVRLPGMELLGIAPSWLLIWTVSWSLKRSVFQGILAGLALGMIQDGMTSAPASGPSHVLSLVLVGFLTAKLQKQRYLKEDLISVALVVFAMSIVAEAAIALQHILHHIRTPEEIWLDYQRISLSSAILTSLWAPVLYYPLNRWWEKLKALERSSLSGIESRHS
ncbi:rod shape-determining protein MreD [Hydrococcus rivularis NIES-593]|uniref:Rod shape-determining protein MreD n=1 Tax=Hydrococcus rivularis NIES-593 TaxID=1921803 RepID=A0A1U7HBS6_9CYAN|nr:rod shape-determining protein MreD [Hydrococcus rivularis]OKH20988.1 rod shape-determining protein MreD [Hydrococcus rivularis NIES-593]